MPGQANSGAAGRQASRRSWANLIRRAPVSPRPAGGTGRDRQNWQYDPGEGRPPPESYLVTEIADAAPHYPRPREGRGTEEGDAGDTPLLMAALGLLMVATAFLSGLFGMAGGLILIGVLLTILPLPSAMVLHAITQMASNGWRAFLWRAHIRWKPVFIYLIGAALALGAWSITRYVPDKPIALLLLGVTPFMARLTPKGLKPNPESIAQGSFYGFICMGLMLMTGVSGPLMDTFFLGGNFGRREVVATKAACQVASHFVKLVYFGGIIAEAATLDPVLAVIAVVASMTGTTLARRFLEAMTDLQFRTWAGRLITTVACYYIIYGSWLLLAPYFESKALAF